MTRLEFTTVWTQNFAVRLAALDSRGNCIIIICTMIWIYLRQYTSGNNPPVSTVFIASIISWHRLETTSIPTLTLDRQLACLTLTFVYWKLEERVYGHIADLHKFNKRKQEWSALKLANGEMQCALTLESLTAILELVIGFVSNFYNWCALSLSTIQWKPKYLN